MRSILWIMCLHVVSAFSPACLDGKISLLTVRSSSTVQQPIMARLSLSAETKSSTGTATERNEIEIAESGIPYDPRLHYMGISQELDELPTGQCSQKQVKTQDDEETELRPIQIEKLSQRPAIFHIKGILTPDECQQIRDAADQSERMEQAQTLMGVDETDQQVRRRSQVVWLPNTSIIPGSIESSSGGNNINLESLARSIHSIFLPHEPQPLQIMNNNNSTAGVEDLQVVNYDTQGEYSLHHDGSFRVLTVIYYLNGVSDTWFPLADHGRRMSSREEALEVIAAMQQQKRETTNSNADIDYSAGVRVSSDDTIQQPGDAIAFYNYFQDGTFEWNAMHAGLPAVESKWIATHWYHHVSPPKDTTGQSV